MNNYTMKNITKRLIAAYRYFNPYHYEGEYCNPWSNLLAEYRRKLTEPYFAYDAQRLGFHKWLIQEAETSAYEKMHDI